MRSSEAAVPCTDLANAERLLKGYEASDPIDGFDCFPLCRDCGNGRWPDSQSLTAWQFQRCHAGTSTCGEPPGRQRYRRNRLRGVYPTALLLFAGPATVAPLALFAWTARRLPFQVLGFLQFISPTIGFGVGLAVGERLNPMGLASFAFIWSGAAVFVLGAWRAGRALQSEA